MSIVLSIIIHVSFANDVVWLKWWGMHCRDCWNFTLHCHVQNYSRDYSFFFSLCTGGSSASWQEHLKFTIHISHDYKTDCVELYFLAVTVSVFISQHWFNFIFMVSTRVTLFRVDIFSATYQMSVCYTVITFFKFLYLMFSTQGIRLQVILKCSSQKLIRVVLRNVILLNQTKLCTELSIPTLINCKLTSKVSQTTFIYKC